MDTIIAALYCGMRKASVCRMPQRNVPAPLIEPRRKGLPRRARSAESERPSEKGMNWCHASPCEAQRTQRLDHERHLSAGTRGDKVTFREWE
jgi:hypothetical protein